MPLLGLKAQLIEILCSMALLLSYFIFYSSFVMLMIELLQ